MTDPDRNRPIQWPGAATLLGFFIFILFLLWTAKGVLPWQ